MMIVWRDDSIASVRVQSQRPIGPSVTSVESVDQEISTGAVHRSLGIYLTPRNSRRNCFRRPSDGVQPIAFKWGSLPQNEVGRIA